MKLWLTAIAASLALVWCSGCACVLLGQCGPETFDQQKARAITSMQNAPGMEYCEVTHGVDPAQFELCIRNAPDEATINRSCFQNQERYQVIEGCMYMAKTINQSRQHNLSCTNNALTGLNCQSN
jgi:hypothetical protein